MTLADSNVGAPAQAAQWFLNEPLGSKGDPEGTYVVRKHPCARTSTAEVPAPGGACLRLAGPQSGGLSRTGPPFLRRESQEADR